jgi:hypothetical protein
MKSYNSSVFTAKHGVLLAAIVAFGVQTGFSQVIPAGMTYSWPGNVGVEGGIPNRTTIYTNLSAGATLSQINSALASCPGNDVVMLAAGDYYLTNGPVFVQNSNVTLRGAGTNTVLHFFGNFYADGLITVGDKVDTDPLDNPGVESYVNWTSGYAQYGSNLVFDSVSGISVGQILCLDQTNDNITVQANPSWEGCSICGRDATGNNPAARSMEQWVKVTAITGTVVTVTPPIYSGLWRSSQQPQAWWYSAGTYGSMVVSSGVENLKVDGTGATPYGAGYSQNLCLRWTWDCWYKNVESYNAAGDHVLVQWGGRNEVRDSYFHVTQNSGGSESYGVTLNLTSGALVENNIFSSITAPMVLGTVSGSVIGYNYVTNEIWLESLGYMQAGLTIHDSHNYMNLVEGNYLNKIVADFYHGGSSHNTIFRNRDAGYESTITDGTPMTGGLACGYIVEKNWYWNFVGNVLGTTNKTMNYESPDLGDDYPSVYALGTANGVSGFSTDPQTKATMFRHGNYDVVTGGIVWSNGFSQTLPTSLYLTNKPSWFNSLPWPPYDPNYPTAASSTNIPAGYRFAYGVNPPGVTAPPPAPVNLIISP